jgi:uncharacterized lipoprotein YbaY
MSAIRLSLLLCAASLLAACQSPVAGSAAPSTGDTLMPADSGTLMVRGRAMYLEKILMPEGSTLRVQLIDDQLADTPDAVIASRDIEVGAGPYDFTLPVERAKLRENGMYGLHASVSMPDGSLRFVTDTRVPVQPGQSGIVEFRLVHVQPRD